MSSTPADQRIVVTGIGATTPLGGTAVETWEGIAMLPERWPEFASAGTNAPAIVGVLFGMAMMHQVSPGSITDEMAVRTLHHLVSSPHIEGATS